jgi:hypothetical protein
MRAQIENSCYTYNVARVNRRSRNRDEIERVIFGVVRSGIGGCMETGAPLSDVGELSPCFCFLDLLKNLQHAISEWSAKQGGW